MAALRNIASKVREMKDRMKGKNVFKRNAVEIEEKVRKSNNRIGKWLLNLALLSTTLVGNAKAERLEIIERNMESPSMTHVFYLPQNQRDSLINDCINPVHVDTINVVGDTAQVFWDTYESGLYGEALYNVFIRIRRNEGVVEIVYKDPNPHNGRIQSYNRRPMGVIPFGPEWNQHGFYSDPQLEGPQRNGFRCASIVKIPTDIIRDTLVWDSVRGVYTVRGILIPDTLLLGGFYRSIITGLPLSVGGEPFHGVWDTLYLGLAFADQGEVGDFYGSWDYPGATFLVQAETSEHYSFAPLSPIFGDSIMFIYYELGVGSVVDSNSADYEGRWNLYNVLKGPLWVEVCDSVSNPQWGPACDYSRRVHISGGGVMPDTLKIGLHPHDAQYNEFARIGGFWAYAFGGNGAEYNPYRNMSIPNYTISRWPPIPWPRQNGSPAVIEFTDGRGNWMRMTIYYEDILYNDYGDPGVVGKEGYRILPSHNMPNAIAVDSVLITYPLPHDTLYPGEAVSYGYHPYPGNVIGDWLELGGFTLRALDTVVLVKENNEEGNVRLVMPEVLYNPAERRAVVVTPYGAHQKIEVKVVDPLGRTLYGAHYNEQEIARNNGKIELDVFKHLLPGHYLLRIETEKDGKRQPYVKRVFVP